MAARYEEKVKPPSEYRPLDFQEKSISEMVAAASAEKPFGKILADEMGLGKTSQILNYSSFTRHQRREGIERKGRIERNRKYKKDWSHFVEEK